MEVNVKDHNMQVSLGSINYGTYFWFKEQLYLKVNINIDHDNFAEVNGYKLVLRLSHEMLLLFYDDTMVTIEIKPLVVAVVKEKKPT